ncbi:MAG TPA: hypothetical protein VFW98_14020, partial [Gemmatimonadaceae bacterium]|nr:hypothetical protein [Gemmatimonadaceae bacterium]
MDEQKTWEAAGVASDAASAGNGTHAGAPTMTAGADAPTQMRFARRGEITDAMRFVAEREGLPPEL